MHPILNRILTLPDAQLAQLASTTAPDRLRDIRRAWAAWTITQLRAGCAFGGWQDAWGGYAATLAARGETPPAAVGAQLALFGAVE